MTTWKIAGVQMDCRLADKAYNLGVIRMRLREAVAKGARLVVFPECALTGYAFDSRDEAVTLAEPVPGPATTLLAEDCRALDAWAIIGLLELGRSANVFFNACALIGPQGIVGSYRKIHLPFLGVDRFATPGDRPFQVHDLGGLRVGMNICYDGSFPESSRVLAVLGADLVVLPTNWPTGAAKTACCLVPARAMENHLYYAAVNRVGEEGGFRFIGQSRFVDCDGELLIPPGSDQEEILYAEVNPAIARQKRIIKIPGKYEIDRVNDRRPEMYGPLCERANLGDEQEGH
ncbi:MAG TPA: carbon-nitrogen hydrolase family protein [Gemmataceae bacterium]|jgi:predicted amidohydrolase|nr:carbon-nitrogen hydrolase family protein [Gemmataceae bacterium]